MHTLPRAVLDAARAPRLFSGRGGSAREARREMTFLDYYLIVLFVALVALLVYKFKS
jgi:hypothetical protein